MDHVAESLCLAALDAAEADSRHAKAEALPLASKAQGGLAVSIEGVAKAYGEKTVLFRLSLTIAPGAFVVIIGKSGCGKSTFLRLLAGLESDPADRGWRCRTGSGGCPAAPAPPGRCGGCRA